MRLPDLLRLAWANVWRNHTRSLLTGTGVMIGVAALFTLLAYGSGLEKNAQQEFNALKLHNTLRVTPHSIPTLTGTNRRAVSVDSVRREDGQVPLTNSLAQEIEAIEGVFAAYPEMQFPAKVRSEGQTLVVSAEGIPQSFGAIPSYQPLHGRFFNRPDEAAILLSPSMINRLGYQGPSAAIGDTVDLITASLNFYKLRSMAELFSDGLRTLPMGQRPHKVRVVGILDDSRQPVSGLVRVLIPLEYGQTLSKITFFSTLDLLFRHAETQEGYSALRVQLEDAASQSGVRRSIEQMGVYTTSFREQFGRLETLFLILDLALGVIGTIALLVAVLGIANTVMMNVRERTREIGIMMAVGGNARDLQSLFVTESAMLGASGAGAGLLLGALIVVGLDRAVNLYLSGLGVPPVTVFDTSLTTALIIWSGAVIVSLLAGVLPARRAARVEPGNALRTV